MTHPAIRPMTPAALQCVRVIERVAQELPQIPIATDHVLHAGLYARTIRIPANTSITGALIKIPTLLVFYGHASVYVGDGMVEIDGYQVIPAAAGRKQVFVAHEDTHLTMLFPTTARSVADAEREFTDEWSLLASQGGAVDSVTITGE